MRLAVGCRVRVSRATAHRTTLLTGWEDTAQTEAHFLNYVQQVIGTPLSLRAGLSPTVHHCRYIWKGRLDLANVQRAKRHDWQRLA